MEKSKPIIVTSGATISYNRICPKCKWKSNDYGEGSGFTSNIEGIRGDWCLRCYVRKITKGLPKMKKFNS